MASITFTGESSESFANSIQYIAGWTVEVTPETGEKFDAVVVESAADTTHDYFGVRVRRYDDDAGEAVGDPFDVIVSDLLVY
jgi:hypothetical protein